MKTVQVKYPVKLASHSTQTVCNNELPWNVTYDSRTELYLNGTKMSQLDILYCWSNIN